MKEIDMILRIIGELSFRCRAGRGVMVSQVIFNLRKNCEKELAIWREGIDMGLSIGGKRGERKEGKRKSIHTKGTACPKGSKGILQELGVGWSRMIGIILVNQTLEGCSGTLFKGIRCLSNEFTFYCKCKRKWIKKGSVMIRIAVFERLLSRENEWQKWKWEDKLLKSSRWLMIMLRTVEMEGNGKAQDK